MLVPFACRLTSKLISMEDPQCSGRPPVAFSSLSMFATMQSSVVASKALSRNPVDFASQQPQASCRQPTVAWFPSFGGRSFGQRVGGTLSRINPPFALGISAGTGGSMLVSHHATFANCDKLFAYGSTKDTLLCPCSIIAEAWRILVVSGHSRVKVHISKSTCFGIASCVNV